MRGYLDLLNRSQDNKLPKMYNKMDSVSDKLGIVIMANDQL